MNSAWPDDSLRDAPHGCRRLRSQAISGAQLGGYGCHNLYRKPCARGLEVDAVVECAGHRFIETGELYILFSGGGLVADGDEDEAEVVEGLWIVRAAA